MKKTILPILIIALLFAACKKKTEDVSTVVKVTYPGIELKGSQYIRVPVGGNYTDEGATLTDDITGGVSDIQASSDNVDYSTPGIYTIDYEAANGNGFKTLVSRYILVLDYTPPSGITLDLSGPWTRTNGIPVNFIKIEDGLYIIDNVGGSTTIIPAYAITPDNSTIEIPEQYTVGEDIDVISESLDLSTAPNYEASWIVLIPGFGTGVRTFIKD